MAHDRALWPIKPDSQIWPLISQSLRPPAQDLLLRANYLFDPANDGVCPLLGGRRSTLRFDESQSPNESRMTRR